MRAHTFIYALFGLCFGLPTFGQNMHVYQGDCDSGATGIHSTGTSESLIMVNMVCDNGSSQWMVCVPENGELIPVISFENEQHWSTFSTDDGFYALSELNNSFVLRHFDNSGNVITTVPLDMQVDLPQSVQMREIHVGDTYLLTGFFEVIQNAMHFTVARLDLASGTHEQSVSFPASMYTFNGLTELVVHDDSTIYIGVTCELRIRINPFDLTDHEVAPLPTHELTGEEFDPCGLPHILRYNPSPEILFTVSFTMDDFEPNYSYDFAYEGNYTITPLWLAENHVLFDQRFESEDVKFIVASAPNESDNDQDLVLYKMTQSNELLNSVRIAVPDWSYKGHVMSIHNSMLHLTGWSALEGQEEGGHATYITVDLNSFGTGVAEVNRRTPVFIHTDEEFGFSDTSIVTRFELYDLTGEMVCAASDAVRLQKSDFLPGTYVVKAYTTESVHSYRVVVN